MRIGKSVLLFICQLLLACSAFSQTPSIGNIFGGYSYWSSNLAPNIRSGLNGWHGSVEIKPLRYFGFVADFSGYYGSEQVLGVSPICAPVQVCVIDARVNQNTLLFGVRGGGWIGKFRPFGQALIGEIRLRESRSPFFYSDTNFAEAIGVGVDYRIVRRAGWRVQVDYLQTIVLGQRVNDARISIGPVFYF